jgi:hypothetical protein
VRSICRSRERANGEAGALERGACEENRFERLVVVAVHAKRVWLNAKDRAIDRCDLVIASHENRAFCCEMRIVKDGVRPVARDERSIGQVRAVDERLASDAKAVRSRFILELASRQREHRK